MRARSLKPGFYKNESLAELPPLARLLFTGLWCLADREGRLEDRPKRIKAEVLPYDETNVDELLGLLHGAGFILRYGGPDSGRYLQIVNFGRHQKPHSNETESLIPAPSEGLSAMVESASPLILDPSSLNPSPLSFSSEPPKAAAAEPEIPDPVYLSFETVGAVKVWDLRKSVLDEFWRLYGKRLDVLGECQKAKAWLDARPGRRKTARGMRAFLTGWLNRACDSGKGWQPITKEQAKAEAEQIRRANEAKRRERQGAPEAVADVVRNLSEKCGV